MIGIEIPLQSLEWWKGQSTGTAQYDDHMEDAPERNSTCVGARGAKAREVWRLLRVWVMTHSATGRGMAHY
jgi:hypothetical protein